MSAMKAPMIKKMIYCSWEERERESDTEFQRPPLEESGIMALETTPQQSKATNPRPAPEDTPLFMEMNESDMMLETSLSDQSN